MTPARRRRRRWLLVALGLLLSAVAMHEHVVRSVQDRIYDSASVPMAECILVPGARIYADGRPYPLLADRLAARGVPADAMHDDALGLRTLDTMQRCGSVMGVRSAIVVTNPFHLARSLFLGVQCGLDVRGVAAPYGSDYSTCTMCKNQGREVVARVWAWLDVFVFGA